MTANGRERLIRAAEAAAVNGLGPSLTELRKLPLDEFGRFIFSLPNPCLPLLSKCLPSMPSPEVQRYWTPWSGDELLDDSLAFVRFAQSCYQQHTARAFADARILDFGCGFGRHLRLLLHSIDPERLYAADPWSRAISACLDHQVLATYCGYEVLDVRLAKEVEIDLAYAYSVLTHTSEPASKAALEALACVVSPGGLLIASLQPEGFWRRWGTQRGMLGSEIAALEDSLRSTGYAFFPLDTPVRGELTYGAATVSVEWFRSELSNWTVLEHVTANGTLQDLIVLQRR